MNNLSLCEQLQQLPDQEARWTYLSECGFYNPQCREILLGFLSGLDIEKYADRVYDGLQMSVIRKGLEMDVDVSIYADPKYDWTQMRAILDGLQQYSADHLKNTYADDRYSGNQMRIILAAMQEDLDVEYLLNPEFGYLQTLTVYIGMQIQLDPAVYAKSQYSADQMMEIQISMKNKYQSRDLERDRYPKPKKNISKKI